MCTAECVLQSVYCICSRCSVTHGTGTWPLAVGVWLLQTAFPVLTIATITIITLSMSGGVCMCRAARPHWVSPCLLSQRVRKGPRRTCTGTGSFMPLAATGLILDLQRLNLRTPVTRETHPISRREGDGRDKKPKTPQFPRISGCDRTYNY